jgi:hypothetical protein
MEKKSSKNGGDVDNQEKELKILLFTYKCVYAKILSCHRLSYLICFWTLTTIVLAAGYAVLDSKRYLLFSTIPFIFVVSASIYYHVIMSLIYHSRYNIETERKIKKLTKLDLLYIEEKCGIFGERESTQLSWYHTIPVVAVFLIGFLTSIVIGAYFAICLLDEWQKLLIITIYIIMSAALLYVVWDGIRYIIKHRGIIKDKRCRDIMETKNQAKTLVDTTEKALTDFRDKVSRDERVRINANIERLKETIKSEDVHMIQAEMEELTRAFDEISTRANQQAGAGAQYQQQAGPKEGEKPQGTEDADKKG